jgi:hypothetical protein
MGFFNRLKKVSKKGRNNGNSSLVKESNLLISDFINSKGKEKKIAKKKLLLLEYKVHLHLKEMRSQVALIERFNKSIREADKELEIVRNIPYGSSEKEKLEHQKSYNLLKSANDDLRNMAKVAIKDLEFKTKSFCSIDEAKDILNRIIVVLKSS